MARCWVPRLAVVAIVLAIGSALRASSAYHSPLATFDSLDKDERSKMRAGRPVVRVLPTTDGEFGVFAALRVDVGPDRLIDWVRAIEKLQRGEYMTAVRRFTQTPQLEDLNGLTLPSEDVVALRDCRPSACSVKLSEAEIEQLRNVAATAGARWKDAVQEEFRRVVLARARAYLADGHRSMAPYKDHPTPVSLSAEFAQIASRSDLQGPYGLRVLGYIQRYPQERVENVEEFLYWAQEKFTGAKPIVTITHTAIFHGLKGEGGAPLVVSKQVFATHYFNSSLSLSQIAGDGDGSKYLLYLRRARLDVPEGVFGSLVRRVVQRKIRTEVPTALEELKRRLESGPPRT